MKKPQVSIIYVNYNTQTFTEASLHTVVKNIKFVLGDASKIPLEDNLVDVVVSFETIEHIPNYIEFISEIKRVLKPGGTFLVSTPNDDEYPEDNEFHVHEFTLKEFKNLMKKEFTYQKYYYQSSWFYTGIFDEDKFTKEWQGEIDTHKVSKIKKNKAPYFIAICSDDKITSKVVNIGAITQPWSDRDNIEYQKSIKNQIKTLEDKNKILENSIMEIKNSRTFKAADKIRKIIKPNRVK